MSGAEKLIDVRSLSYSIGGKSVLSDISFSVARGGFLAIIGPNGAGKSTLLKCLGGLNETTEGEVFIGGRGVRSMSERDIARRVAWLHQSGGDRLPFTVRQFAMLSRYPWRPVLSGASSEDEAFVAEALRGAGVEKLAERRISTLSGGERQRALLAAALAQGTDMLFLDEPTSFLDYRHQVDMMALIEEINGRGMTVLMVTHDINLALHGAGDILAVKDGRAVWRGSAGDICEDGVLSDIFETDFEFFRAAGGERPYAVPRGIIR
ncbi:MAG: ABC transporter ATP-binding protein [Synergistaceae bacterium]|nr:ABC transporter ATP-binding protein [Synergistaceae bacterium]